MKKIASVFITAVVFLAGMLNVSFAVDKEEGAKINRQTEKRKKLPAVKFDNLEQGKFDDLDQGRLTDLEVEAGLKDELKDGDLNKTDIKFQDLEMEAGLKDKLKNRDLDKTDIKFQDLEKEAGKFDDLDITR